MPRQPILEHGPVDAERLEYEQVLAALARTPRLASLLRFLMSRHFSGEQAQLTEFNIATQVFGRKPSDFASSEDAIARVETHRLRRRLREYYLTEGRDHPLQITIPARTFAPAIVDTAPAMPATAAPIGVSTADVTPPSDPPDSANTTNNRVPPIDSLGQGPANVIGRRWAVALAVLLTLGALAGVFAYRHSRALSATSATGKFFSREAASSALGRSPLPVSGGVPVRILAGYAGIPQSDEFGNVWGPDRFFSGGWTLHQPASVVPRTNNPMLFQDARAGEVTYNIPLPPGTYELHLYFLQSAETALAVQTADGEDKTRFKVFINGIRMLTDFDIASDAMGYNVADERVFRDVSPASDGLLHIHLSPILGIPTIRAIAVLPGTSHKQLPLRIASQMLPFTSQNGIRWGSDDYFLGGRHLTHALPVKADRESEFLAGERYGHFSYALPVDPRDSYTVTLYFAELYFSGAEGQREGSRVFRVLCNGTTLLDNFDIYKEAGPYRVVEKTFRHIKPSAQGKINLTFEPVTNYATVSAIQVLDEPD